MKKRCTAIVLAAGAGRRMKSGVAKQFMTIQDKPLIWYALHAVEQSNIIDDCILVTGEEDIPYVTKEIVDHYGFSKVAAVVAGGNERYASVYNGLRAISDGTLLVPNEDGYVFIQDGARPFLTEKILEDLFVSVQECDACVAAVPVKDTIKISDEHGFVAQTPNRNYVWAVQTPQTFSVKVAVEAYNKLMEQLDELSAQGIAITDDAMVVEYMLHKPVKLVEASYENIKITTPDDLLSAERILSSKKD